MDNETLISGPIKRFGVFLVPGIDRMGPVTHSCNPVVHYWHQDCGCEQKGGGQLLGLKLSNFCTGFSHKTLYLYWLARGTGKLWESYAATKIPRCWLSLHSQKPFYLRF